MSHQILRLDTDHHIAHLMQKVVDQVCSSPLHVRLTSHVVTLSGNVTTWHQKQLAQESIRRLAAGRQVRNNIRVATAAQTLADLTLAD